MLWLSYVANGSHINYPEPWPGLTFVICVVVVVLVVSEVMVWALINIPGSASDPASFCNIQHKTMSES